MSVVSYSVTSRKRKRGTVAENGELERLKTRNGNRGTVAENVELEGLRTRNRKRGIVAENDDLVKLRNENGDVQSQRYRRRILSIIYDMGDSLHESYV